MLFHLSNRDLPSTHGMALFAIRAQLPPVNVGVTILAALPHVAEDHLHVALGASHRSVHPAQRISGLVVIEFRQCPDGSPSIRGVAVLAGDGEISVRTVRAFLGLRSRGR